MEQANQAPAVEANFDNTFDKVPVKFNFRKQTVKDEATGLETETKRPTVELELPLITVEGIVAAANAGGNALQLIVDACREVQLARARELVNENEAINADNFPYGQLAWEVIANLPKAERRGGGIPKELWEEFATDYVAVMPAVTGKSVEQIKNAAKILVARLQPSKTNKPVLKLLKDQLALYTNSSANAENFADIIEFLNGKADSFLAMDDAALLANL